MATALPLVNVTVRLVDQDGDPVIGAKVSAKLMTVERYKGYVIPEEYLGVTDDQGTCIVRLFPNELGTEGSEYRFKISYPKTSNGKSLPSCHIGGSSCYSQGGKSLTVYASIPNADCNLEDVCDLDPYPIRGSGQIFTEHVLSAAEAAKKAAQDVENIKPDIEAAKQAAITATTKASIAESAATIAGLKADESASKAAESSSWASRAKAWAESTSIPNPDEPDSKSAKSWAEEAKSWSDEAKTHNNQMPVTATGTTTPRPIADRFADIVNVKDFGAKGDGVTDDTEAIQAADVAAALAGKTLLFPDGEYVMDSTTMTAGWHMDKNAKIIPVDGLQSNVFLTCSENSLDSGFIHIDANEIEIDKIFSISGDKNVFESIFIENATATTIETRGIHVTGNGNTIHSVKFKNFVKTGYDNDSMPQGLTTSGSANGNYFSSVWGVNTRSLVVAANTSGSNVFDEVCAYDCYDNGFYAVAPGHSQVGSLYYNGHDNALGLRHGCNIDIGSVYITGDSVTYAIFIGSCGNVNIGTVYAADIDGMLLGLNHVDEDNYKHIVHIENIVGRCNNAVIFLPHEETNPNHTGYIDKLSIGHISVESTYQPSVNSFMRLDACKQIAINSIYIKTKLLDSEGKVYHIKLNENLSGYSWLKHAVFEFENPNGTSHTLSNVTLDNAAQSNFILSEGFVSSSNGHVYRDKNSVDRLTGGIPPSGYYERGTVIWNIGASTSDIAGFICTESGSPGSWSVIPVFTEAGKVASLEAVATLKIGNKVYPTTDNFSSLGNSANRFSSCWLASGTISSSDRRLKTDIDNIDESLMKAWGSVRFKIFKFKDSVAEKGDKARLHLGFIAQEIDEAFKNNGLDASRYGLFCYDKWEDEYEEEIVVDEEAVLDCDDNEISPAKTHVNHKKIREAGDRYSIRYEEALALECAYQRWLGEKREQRIAALEAAIKKS